MMTQKRMPTVTSLLFSLLFIAFTQAQSSYKSWGKLIKDRTAEWYATDEAKQVAENVLLYQRDIGGWPKNKAMQKPLSSDDREKLLALKSRGIGCTTDNGATIQEMLFLSNLYRQVPDKKYKNAFLKAIDYILEAQYKSNGGWPQFYPLRKGYYSHITYNDDSMINIMKLLKELLDETNYYSIKPSEKTLRRIQLAFDKGIDCIIKTQYRQNGKLTSWGAQHDTLTLKPAKARAYELSSLSGKESAQIVRFLMTIDNPSEAVKNAINSAVVWFDRVKITGSEKDKIFKIVKELSVNERMLPRFKSASIWARFMELSDNRPFFCDRDGIKKYSIAEIGAERRNGYAWYTNEPKEIFKKYAKWLKKYPLKKKLNSKTD